ncbi:ArsR/SmtB family transcription factor [Leisingera sp. XS_AS12]|uniref:ArsR/SmtB family transcription factor n=1 Tax=Leisingera sp. XS_AS12 TaxID=3241294 RepID=UPI001C942164|nr:metalloregulator ArsR/SmtB family transcription factor [Nocardioides marinus]
MQWEEAAQGFAAMGSEARLQVLRCLIRAGEAGLTVGEIQERTGIAPSTLAHHLKFLAGAGVVTQQRQGRATINRADFTRLEALAGFILSECCADAGAKAANDG